MEGWRGGTIGRVHITVADPRYPSEQGEYNALYANLYEVIISGDKSKLIVKPEQAIDVLRLIELGQKAAREERVVRVNEL